MLLIEDVVCGACSKELMGGLGNCSSPPLLLEGGLVGWEEPLLAGRERVSFCTRREGKALFWEDRKGESLETPRGFCWKGGEGPLWDAVRGMKGITSLGEMASLLTCGLLLGFETRDKVYGMGGRESEEVGCSWAKDAVAWKVEEDGGSGNLEREDSF